jgi:ATP-dependent RNA helicase RhlE
MKFENYHISPQIKENLTQMGFKRPTDIQFKAIPSIMKGEDVLAIAQTGTGKTAAFGIPVIDAIHRWKSSKRSWGIKCIVMVPTRELASQIGKVLEALSKHTRVTAFAVYGGVEQDAQIKKLSDGIDMLVATPGRMFDLISQKAISVDKVTTLVLDEADQMLDLGFIDDIRAIKSKLQHKHQTLFFSATISKKIKKLAFSQVKSTAIRIQISPEDPVSKNVSHYVVFVEMDAKRFFLRRFVYDHPNAKILVFVRTRVRAERVAKALDRGSIACITLHGEKEQKDRIDAMKQFKKGETHILVATDVSARGIDIPNVDYVINYDLPEKDETYVHRVGRTGRGSQKGVALSYCSTEEKHRLSSIQDYLGKPIETIAVSKEEYAVTIGFSDEKKGLLQMIREQESHKKKQRRKK